MSKKKKRILLLSDDLRMSSGVGTVSKNFVMGTMDKYEWVQIAGAIKHPEEGKIVDMNDAVAKELNMEKAYLKIYPVSGYGNQELLRQVMNMEKPDAILHYTDPRFWGWLYQMEHELRQEIPIFYYNIWDDWPAPQYNENYYECCDLIMNISKQTVAIVDEVAKNKPRTDTDSTYLPHGINEDFFYPITDKKELAEMKKFKQELVGNKPIDFILLYVNRNIRRKLPGDCILAFKEFWDTLPDDKKDRVAYIMHTQPRDENGTDLPEVARVLAPDCNIIFSDKKLENKQMNFLYNMSDVTMNLASNEGFGLGTCESLMSGTPIIVTMTGGLQQQVTDGEEWFGVGIEPSSKSVIGSQEVPYIYEDRISKDDFIQALKKIYNMTKEERKELGRKGRDYVLKEYSFSKYCNSWDVLLQHIVEKYGSWENRKNYNTWTFKEVA